MHNGIYPKRMIYFSIKKKKKKKLENIYVTTMDWEYLKRDAEEKRKGNLIFFNNLMIDLYRDTLFDWER